MYRSFATVCLIAVAAQAKAQTDYSLENTLLRRAKAKNTKVHPDKVPNWMRGFYDDFHHDENEDTHHDQQQQ